MVLEVCLMSSIHDFFASLSYIFDVAPITFQAINEIVTLTDTFLHGIVGLVICLKHFVVPDMEILLQYLEGIWSITTLAWGWVVCWDFSPYQCDSEGRRFSI